MLSLAGREHLDFAHGRLGREVDAADRPRLPGAVRVDADGLVAAAGPDFVGIRPVPERQVIDRRLFSALALVEPASDPAAADPDGVALQPDAVAAGDGRAEASNCIRRHR